MSQPRRFRSHDNATGTGPGDVLTTRAHPQFGIFIQADGIDPGADTLELTLEVSPDEEVWAPVDNPAPNVQDVFGITQDDLIESANGVYTKYTSHHNIPIEYVRTNITGHSGGFEVTTDLYLSGWTQRGASFDYAVYD